MTLWTIITFLEKAKLWRLVGRGKESWIGKSIEEFYGNETILYETTIEDTCRCTVVKPTEWTTSRVNLMETHELGDNDVSNVGSLDADSGNGAYAGSMSMWELPWTLFKCFELKTALRHKVCLKILKIIFYYYIKWNTKSFEIS